MFEFPFKRPDNVLQDIEQRWEGKDVAGIGQPSLLECNFMNVSIINCRLT